MNKLRYKLPIIFIFIDIIFYLLTSIEKEWFIVWYFFHIPSSLIVDSINDKYPISDVFFLILGLFQTGIIFYVEGIMREKINKKHQHNSL